MIIVFETDSKIEADAITQRLRSMGIACVVDGQHSAGLAGFYVPRVLQVRVLDASDSSRARRIANEVVDALNRLRVDAPSTKRLSVTVVVGVFLVAVAMIVAILRVIDALTG